MKLMHLSDFHLGKLVNGFSMLDDQKFILQEILRIAEEEKPDGILLAGDIYDRQIPSAEAVDLFDDFLVRLAAGAFPVFLISGNHDSAERLAFGGRLMVPSGIHIAPVYDGQILPISLNDSHGTVNIYLLPFLKPAHVRRFFPQEQIDTLADAMQVIINSLSIREEERNILVTHQFVAGAEISDSEDISVGGTDPVPADVFAPFDYVALGHLHKAQQAGKSWIRYCGSPLKYSFSEANHEKSITFVELSEKGNVQIRTVPLHPRHDMVEIRGTYEELVQKSYYEHTSLQEDYVHITLTDEESIWNAVARLRVIYHNLMRLDYDNTRTRHSQELHLSVEPEKSDPLELFSAFYTQQNGQDLSQEQRQYLSEIIKEIWDRTGTDR